MSLTKIEYADFLQKAVFKTQEIGQFSILFELFDYIDLHEESYPYWNGVTFMEALAFALAPSTNLGNQLLTNLSSSK